MKQLEDLHGILRHCYTKSSKAGEQFIGEHGISFIVSGEMEAYDGNTKHLYQKGDVVLYRKNALIRFVKYPHQEKCFEAISIILDEKLLKIFAEQYEIFSDKSPKESLFKLKEDELIQTYFKGLETWFSNKISTELATVKKTEMILLVLRNNKEFKNILFHFGMPGKVNLEAFMNTHFRFNVPLSQLAFLTGRSLATFKRDFEKLFQMSPHKWIQQKRLEEAHYLLKHKKMKVKDVYLEVGFETLSHFSYTFKNHFGVSPSRL
ncbi:MAG: AraC family transcriptional regulator [Chryseobacterium sp.]|uniref:helix-turn-helix domain-containing protein n=1 Tax=Chryseobacterium sp. TaxID=1871047 RepID=UPI0025BA2D6E|nr:AraC family transcriptional regulator [Chryseobacterium sp.]MCJ7932329.1 AraC family transcriptional regulator [Chryseobacterium sp.]